MPLTINPFESNPGWDLIKALYYYYGLQDYFQFWYYEQFKKGKILNIRAYDKDNKPGDRFFWRKVFSGELNQGQPIRLLDFQISPWFPRKPGLYWTVDAVKAREKAYEHIEGVTKNGLIFDVWGKTLMTELGGIGTVNFRKDRDFSLITATSSGKTEEGIPLVCRTSVWNKIETEFKVNKRLEVDIEGFLVHVNAEHDSYFLRSPGIPKVAILINSILNTKIKSSAVPVKVSPWTIFKTEDQTNPYGFTYITHNLSDDDLEVSKDWLIEYVYNHNGSTILTDFDENLHQLNAIFPLNDVINGNILNETVIGYTQQILKDFKRD